MGGSGVMKRLTSKVLIVISFLVFGTSFITPEVSAIGANFFDTSGVGADCDMLTPNGGSAACGVSGYGVRLRAGNTSRVPKQRIHVKAYYSNLLDAAGNIDTSKFAGSNGPYIEIPGFSYCPDNPTSVNSRDLQVNGYYEGKTLTNTFESTRFYIGGDYIRDTGNEDRDRTTGSLVTSVWRSPTSLYCDSSDPAYTRTIKVQPSWLRKESGMTGNYVSLEILVLPRFHDPAGNNLPSIDWNEGRTDCSLTYVGRCEGVVNSFTLRQSYVGSVSTNGYIATIGELGDIGSTYGYGVTLGNSSDTQNMTYRMRFGSDCTVRPGHPRVAIKFYDFDYTESAGQAPLKVRLRDETIGRWKTPGTYGQFQTDAWTTTPVVYTPTTGVLEADQPPSNNGGITRYWFNPLPNHKYYIDLLNNDGGLVFQYGLPFDSIFNRVDCKEGLQANISLTGSTGVEAGETVTAGASVVNSGADHNAKYERFFWFTNDTALAPTGAGNTMIRSATPPTEMTWPTGTTNSPKLAPDGVTDVLQTWSTTANGSYRYVCTVARLFAPNPNTLTPENPEKICRPIGKYPTLQVHGGDARSGGVTPQGVICSLTDTASVGRVIGHNFTTAGRGSFGQFGVLSSGSITSFGSAGFQAVSGPSSKQLFFGSTTAYPSPPALAKDGYFYLPKDLGAYPSATTTHCLPDMSNVYPLGAAPTTIASSTPSFAVPIVASTDSKHEYRFAQNTDDETSTITVPAIALAANQQVSIRVDGPGDCSEGRYIVRLTGNITVVAPSYNSIYDIPRFYLIVNSPCVDVVMADTVSFLYGMFATTGDMMTCQGGNSNGFDGSTTASYGAEGVPLLTSANCTAGVRVDGAVIIGGKLYSYRTRGDGSFALPAEIFNLHPLYTISDYARARDGGGQGAALRVDSQMELPPRF
jgi:hypothetical protein